ncbi:MAG: peptide chain release factor N(5)-glutamine methyltransferase [Clostridia bacterium]|nr:peptide chain release factor N(5)-glutamine methyltransferase [Clostridia bacterium]
MNNLTLSQWYRRARTQLAAVPVDFPEVEALLLCEAVTGLRGRAAITLHGDDILPDDAAERLEQMLSRRADRPLQYILGEWEFCDMRLCVGEGVLVPREDTTALVECVCERLRGKTSPRLLDLCAGSGAVALAAVQRIPNLRAVCVELSQEALPYLRRNVELYGDGRVDIVCADLLQPPSDEVFAARSFDVIASNPPYIPSGEISTLSREVRQEPSMALDGGGDGLRFYRAIASLWMPLLKASGTLAVEIGKGQETDVEGIFVRHSLRDIARKEDFSGIIRVIYGTIA